MPLNPLISPATVRRLAALLLLATCCQLVLAQGTDTLALIRQLIRAGAAYRQLPLQVEMEMKNTTNFIMSEDDTASTTGSFYFLPQAAYVRMGEAEQLINDTQALVVSSRLQQMMLYANARGALAQLQMPGGLAWQDSSARQIANRYTLQRLPGENGQEAYRITDKRLLYGTTLPRESMELQFEAGTHRPLAMHTLKRTLVPLEVEEYTSLRQNALLAGKLLNLEDKEYYLVREQQNSFVYKDIRHDKELKLPVSITDRIRQDEQGSYQPVAAYKHFALSIHE